MFEVGQAVRAWRDIDCVDRGIIPEGTIGWIIKDVGDDPPDTLYHITFPAVPHPTRPGNYWMLSGDSLEVLSDG